MPNAFEMLAQRLGRAPLWVDFERYAAAVFAGAPGDWYGDAHRFAATMAQARSLVRADLVSVPVLAPYLIEAAWGPGCGSPLGEALDTLCGQPAAQHFTADALDALFHRLDGKSELVLELPSPSRLLRLRGISGELDFGDMDDVATTLTALLRELSGRRFCAMAIACDEAQGLSEDEWDACGPLIKVARHYGWSVAVRLDGSDEAAEGHLPERGEADLLLLPRWSGEAVAALGPWAGGGLNDAFWRDPQVPVPRGVALQFGVIPADAVPEQIAQRLQELAA